MSSYCVSLLCLTGETTRFCSPFSYGRLLFYVDASFMSYEHFNFPVWYSPFGSLSLATKAIPRIWSYFFSFHISRLHFSYSVALLQDLRVIKEYFVCTKQHKCLSFQETVYVCLILSCRFATSQCQIHPSVLFLLPPKLGTCELCFCLASC